MSTTSAIAGLGAGLMTGMQFIQNKRNQEAQLAQRDRLLDMQSQEFGMKQAEFDQKKADKELAGWMDQQYRDTYARTDLDEWGKAQAFATTILPRAKIEHMEAASKAAEGMRQTFGVQAIEQLKGGDLTGINRLLDQKFPGSKALSDGKTISILNPDGSVKQQIDRAGLMSMLALSDAQKAAAAQAKAGMDSLEAAGKIGKTQAEIAELNARAEKHGRQYQPEFEQDEDGNWIIRPGTGGGSRSRSTKPVAQPGDMLPADAYLKRFGISESSDPDTRAGGEAAYRHYLALRKANPQAGTVDGDAAAVGLSMDLALGRVKPKTTFDPSTLSWQNTVSNGKATFNMGKADLEAKDAEGKPLIDKALVEREEIGALRSFAQAQPQAYRMAVGMAQDKGLTDAELAAAASGQPIANASGQAVAIPPAVANAALMVRRRGVEQAKPAAAKGAKPAPQASGGIKRYGGDNPSMVGEMAGNFYSGLRRHLDSVRRANSDNDNFSGAL